MLTGGQTATETGHASRAEPLAIRMLWPLAALACIGGIFLCYHVWLIATDNIGTFHNVAKSADLDSDGDLDVVLNNVRQESEFTAFAVATLWVNQGDGQFVARRLEGASGEAGWASAPGDVDRDGDVDLFVFPGWHLRLIINQGGAQGGKAGEFRVNNVVGAPGKLAQFGSVLVDDLNKDGQLDGIVAGCCGRAFPLDRSDVPTISWVWINAWESRDGLVPPHNVSVISALDGLAMRAAALGDVDGDGDLDLFAAVIAPRQGQNRDPADRVLLNDGSGAFADSGQRLGDSDSHAVALGDLDGDGDLDALVGKGDRAEPWINQGGVQGGQAGVFARSTQSMFRGRVRALFLSDLDADGDVDALIAARRGATVWWNDGRAAFRRSSQRLRYSKKHGLTVGDFNADGYADVFAGAYSSDYRVWYNQGDGTFRTDVGSLRTEEGRPGGG